MQFAHLKPRCWSTAVGDKGCLLTEFHKQFCTPLSNLYVRFLFARHCRPTLFAYVVLSLPGICFFQFFELLIFLRYLVKLLDTNWRQAGNDGIFSLLLSHFPGSAVGNPSTPSKADDG